MTKEQLMRRATVPAPAVRVVQGRYKNKRSKVKKFAGESMEIYQRETGSVGASAADVVPEKCV